VFIIIIIINYQCQTPNFNHIKGFQLVFIIDA